MIVYLGSRARRCPICGVGIKPKNLGRHLNRVHPIYSYEIPKISVSLKCVFCGKTKDLFKTKHGLPICNEHYVSDVRKFIVQDFYLKLKAENSHALRDNPEIAAWMANYILNKINSLLTWEPETIPESQFILFSETSFFAGYLLLRLAETIPNLGEILHAISLSRLKEPTSAKSEMKINKLFMDMTMEYELYVGIKFAASGYFDIATDDEEKPNLILIVPKCDEEATYNILQLRLKDANAEWHGTFRKIVVPYGTSTAYDESGSSFRFQRDTIKDHFEDFKKAWKKIFGKSTRMSPQDFEKLWDWLKWVVSPDGFTEKYTKTATWFDEYKKFGLRKDLVFEVLDQILPDLNSHQYLISTKYLTQKDPTLALSSKLARVSRGFKLPCSESWIYFAACREWFYNTIMPVFVEFARSLHLAGSLFEEDIAMISSFYSTTGLQTGSLSSFGIMIEPKIREKKEEMIKTSRNIPWKILGKNVSVTMPIDDITSKIGSSGEVDIIVYANMNIYLIELKALDLDSKEALEYCQRKAPVQCARYAHWVRNSSGFKKILQDHGISRKDFKSVRILTCSSGGFTELFAKCQETGEVFAIVPEYILFSVMGGLFTLSLKYPFPQRISTITPSLRLATVGRHLKILQLDTDNVLRERISSRLLEWAELITFDRRKTLREFEFDPEHAKSYSFFKANYLMNEVYLEGTIDWILERPVQIGEAQGYKFYMGTQIGNIGTSLICEKCKTVVRYYWPRNHKEGKGIEKIFQRALCPFCGHKTQYQGKYPDRLIHPLVYTTKSQVAPEAIAKAKNSVRILRSAEFTVLMNKFIELMEKGWKIEDPSERLAFMDKILPLEKFEMLFRPAETSVVSLDDISSIM